MLGVARRDRHLGAASVLAVAYALGDDAFVSARQENLETIHKHNVVAERHGLLGDLRHEVDLGERVGRDVTKREWLEDVPRPARL